MHKPSDDPFLDPETMYKELTPPGPVLSPEELRAILDESTVGDAIDPDHYKVGGIETIDYMKAKSTPEEFEGYLRLSSLKYLSRAGHKGEALEDYRKALWFVTRLVEEGERE
jgi:hypothetical protein